MNEQVVFLITGMAVAFMFAAQTGWRPLRYIRRVTENIARRREGGGGS